MVDPTNALPFDFTQFVARRHDLQPDAAATLVQGWMSTYVPGPTARVTCQRRVRAA